VVAPGEHAERLFARQLSGSALGAAAASLVVAEWTDPGGDPESPRFIAPLHVHHEDDEAWYVLTGELVVRSHNHDHRLTAGGAVLVPRGVVHTYWNPTAEASTYLLVMTRRIQSLINALHSLEQPDEPTIATVRGACQQLSRVALTLPVEAPAADGGGPPLRAERLSLVGR
jgi:mannose-6-phosphate isomerase-like protein (cupin superfamily)